MSTADEQLDTDLSCAEDYPEHDWRPGDLECRRCGADLSEWGYDAERIGLVKPS